MTNKQFPADEVERRVAEEHSALKLIKEHDAGLSRLLKERRATLLQAYPELDKELARRGFAVVLIAIARMALRYGSWSSDYHAYHNEGHILTLLGDRFDRLREAPLAGRLKGIDWLLLAIFAACHDLRQREQGRAGGGVGNNELASIAETHRILRAVGFSRHANALLFDITESMIAGSTFIVETPTRDESIGAEAVHSGGAYAPTLVTAQKNATPGWIDSPEICRRLNLTLIAADLDTANVAEDFWLLSRSAVDLCIEREKRAGRPLDRPGSARAVLDFLADDQESYFFRLHRFHSEIAEQAFATTKALNGHLVTALSNRIRQDYAHADFVTLQAGTIIQRYLNLAEQLRA